jgi:hypothetical protein
LTGEEERGYANLRKYKRILKMRREKRKKER